MCVVKHPAELICEHHIPLTNVNHQLLAWHWLLDSTKNDKLLPACYVVSPFVFPSASFSLFRLFGLKWQDWIGMCKCLLVNMNLTSWIDKERKVRETWSWLCIMCLLFFTPFSVKKVFSMDFFSGHRAIDGKKILNPPLCAVFL